MNEIHTCHAKCPCQRGERPRSDFLEARVFPSDEAVEAAIRAFDLAPEAEHDGDLSDFRAALVAALPFLEAAVRADERNKVKERVEQVILGHIGEPVRPVPERRAEWGPRCAGCDADEFRHDGYCSIECRDAQFFAADVLAALSTSQGEEA